jgi:hypothetical protein
MIERYSQERVIDGQELYFLSEKEWYEVFNSGHFRDKLLSKRLIDKIKHVEIPLSIRYQKLVITLGFFGVNKEVFLLALEI